MVGCVGFSHGIIVSGWANPPAAVHRYSDNNYHHLLRMLDSQPADELPPPAYELSQETFDQKTQQGIQASLSVPADVQEQWEVWDEAEFEANAHSTADASSSSSSSVPAPPVTAQQYPKEKTPRPPSPPTLEQEEPAVRPLRIVKKSQTAAYQKAVEASSYQSNKPASSTDEGGPLSRSFSVLSAGRRTPPPVFEPFGPSYDGPDYDEVTYVPGNSRPSSPMSVLSADSYRSPPPRPNMLVPPPPPPPIQHQPAPKPPMHTQAQRPPRPQYPPRRRVGFDPMSAYKPKSVFTPGLEPTPERVDPASFYK